MKKSIECLSTNPNFTRYCHHSLTISCQSSNKCAFLITKTRSHAYFFFCCKKCCINVTLKIIWRKRLPIHRLHITGQRTIQTKWDKRSVNNVYKYNTTIDFLNCHSVVTQYLYLRTNAVCVKKI